jgi:two-component system, NtrC family, nitrogen regulation response regulator GlnG
LEGGIRTTAARELVQGPMGLRPISCRVLSGTSAGQELVLQPRRVATLGASRSCDLVLDDPLVSGQHVELEVDPGGVRVRDLKSKNGTSWGATRLTEAVVPVGSVLLLGDTRLILNFAHQPQLRATDRTSFGELVGTSPAMRNLFAILEAAAPTDATVVIEGESGTGKELCARAIHDASTRRERPFVVFDGGAVNAQLVDSQLFGHVRGAFTGAETERQGAFVRANHGTIFLDEIGDLPLDIQVKLLRVLEDRSVQPIGKDERVRVDARVVVATHRNLAQLMRAGRFREDLFHRLSVVLVTMPPLRERPEDISLLVREIYRQRHTEPGPIAGPNLAALSAYGWPGNVRELRNVIERAIVLAPASKRFEDLQLILQAETGSAAAPIDSGLPFKDAKQKLLDAFEARYLSQVLARSSGVLTKAAAHAGLSTKHLRRLLEKYGLRTDDGE